MSETKKRGQVTIFVIVGLVLILVVTLFMFARKNIISGPAESGTHDFSSLISGYEVHAERCLEDTGKVVLKRIFLNGGYTNPQEEGFFGVENYPTKGTGLFLGDQLVPYWVDYKGSLDCAYGCSASYNIPPLLPGEGEKSVEERLQEGVENEVVSCLNSFSYTPDYEVSMSDDVSVTVFFNEGGIQYELTRPISITFLQTGATTTKEEVSAFSVVPAYALYQNAVAYINQLELSNGTATLGNAVKTIIQTYGLTDDPELPPMYGPSIFTAKRPQYWLLPDVKEVLQRHLADNLQFVQVVGSNEEQLFLDPNHYSQALYQNREFNLEYFYPYPDTIGRTSFDLYYSPDWDIELDVYPSKGFLIMPNNAQFLNFIPGFSFGITDYRFGYDVRVPVMVIIKDASAFGGDGLTLMFAIETGLVNNIPFSSSENITVDVGLNNDLFNDDAYWSDTSYTIKTVDALSKRALSDVSLNYICGADQADLGLANDNGVLVSSLPYCWGGVIAANKEGYASKNYAFDVDDVAGALVIELYPLKEFDVVVNTFVLSKEYPATINESLKPVSQDDGSVWVLGNQPGSVFGNDQATITINKIPVRGEDEIQEALFVNGTNKLDQKVTLGLGNYSLEGLVVKIQDGVIHTIPKDTICWQENLGLTEECEDILAIELNNSLLLGGVSFTEENNLTFELTKEDYVANTLVINLALIDITDLKKHADLGVFGLTDEITRVFNETLKPRFE